MNLHRFYAISQIEYCRNFIFKRHFPIRNLFRALLRVGTLAADGRTKSRSSSVSRIKKRLKGKAAHDPRASRARSSRLARLLEERLCQTVREVSHFPQRRSVQQQSRRLSSEEISR